MEDDNLVTMELDELGYFLSKFEDSENSFEEELEEHQKEVNKSE